MTQNQLNESSGFVRTPTGKKAFIYRVVNGMARIRYWESDKLADIELSRLIPWEERKHGTQNKRRSL